jgi:hypothetical protein
MAFDAGSRWDRFDFVWPNLEPSNNNWSTHVLEAYDSVVDDLQDGGVQNLIGILLWTPGWADTRQVAAPDQQLPRGRPPGWYAPTSRVALSPHSVAAWSTPPRGLDLAWDDPNNHWGDFVYTVVSRYKDRVKHWEMWNEPEWSYFWTGSDGDYARLLKVGYQATKAACPDCTVLFGGLHYWADRSFYERVLDILNDDPQAAVNNYFFDVMSLHLYSRSSTVYDEVTEIRGRMSVYVPEHPIWLTETGVPVWGDPNVGWKDKYDYAATQDEAGAYVLQSYANARAAGLGRYLFFRTHDEAMGEYFGLIRNDRSLRPAYVAYQVAASYLISPTMVTHWSYSQGYRRVTLWGTPHGKVSVIWSELPDALTVGHEAALSQATLIDRWGATQAIVATGGVYTLQLPGATANLVSEPSDYFIGGEPFLVVEADTTPPVVTLQPLPATTYSHTIPLAWTASDPSSGEPAGIWGVDLQVRVGAGSGGTWTDWLRFRQTQGTTSAWYSGGLHEETYCFRARAWDRAGNRGDWPAGAQACTRLYRERQVRMMLGAIFGDTDSDGVRDAGEQAITDVTLRWLDGAGADAIAPAVGGSWSFTTTVLGGEFTLALTPAGWWSPPPGWLPSHRSATVIPGETVLDLSYPQIGLHRHAVSYLFPLAGADG